MEDYSGVELYANRRQGLLHWTGQDVDDIGAHAKRERNLESKAEGAVHAHPVHNRPWDCDVGVQRFFADVHACVEPAYRYTWLVGCESGYWQMTDRWPTVWRVFTD